MKCNFILFIFVSLLLFALFGCNADKGGRNPGFLPDENSSDKETVTYSSSSERKIIYNVSADLYIENNFEEKVEALKNSINDDEWTDYEIIRENFAQITFRIKTTRLDDFIDSLSNYGNAKNISKRATDVSLTYQDTTNQIMALEAERERLVELYDQATIEEIIQINARISQIDKELRVLNGEIIRYDSQIEYSEVNVSIYNEAPAKEELSYGEKLKQAFTNGFKGFVKFLEYISLGIAAVFSFLLVFGSLGTGIYFICRFTKKKKSQSEKLIAAVKIRKAFHPLMKERNAFFFF